MWTHTRSPVPWANLQLLHAPTTFLRAVNSYRHPEGLQTLWPLALAFTAAIPRGFHVASSPESQGPAQMEMQLTLLLPFFCLSVTTCWSHWSCISPLRQEKCLSDPCCSLTALVAKSNRWCPHHLLLITCSGKCSFFEWSQGLHPLSPKFKISSFLKDHWCCCFCFFSPFILWTPLVQQWLFNKEAHMHRSLNQSTLKLICCFMAGSFHTGHKRRAQHRHFSPSKWGKKILFANHLSTRLAAKVHELQSMNNYRLLFISKPEKNIRWQLLFLNHEK